MKKINNLKKIIVVGVVVFTGIVGVSAAAVAQGWTLNFSGSVSGFLEGSLYSRYNILTSRLIPKSDSKATLKVTPYKNNKNNGSKMTTVSFTNMKTNVHQLKQHTTSATGNTYYVHMSNSNTSLSANYNLISSDDVQQ